MRNLRTSEEQNHSASNIPMVSGGLSPPIIARNATASYIQLKRNDTRVVPARVKNTFPWVQIYPPSSVAYGASFPPEGKPSVGSASYIESASNFNPSKNIL